MAATIPVPQLISVDELNSELGDPLLRIYDASSLSGVDPEDGIYKVGSALSAYLEGHIPGAAYVDQNESLSDPESAIRFSVPSADYFAAAAGALGIGDDTKVVVYSQTTPMWATRLWWTLRYFGFDNVRILDGGLPAWKAASLPLENEQRTYPAATFSASPRSELLASQDDVLRHVSSGDVCLLNALPEEIFTGEANPYGRPGHIPGSSNLNHLHLFTENPEDGVPYFRPVEELRKILAESGILDQEEIVVYCGGGVSATVNIVALGLCGRQDVALYDGSLSEWLHNDLPLQTSVG